jgi:hypothetical protein
LKDASSWSDSEGKEMKKVALAFAMLLALSAQVPAASTQPKRTLTYEFGYNTKVAKSGPGTGVTTITIGGIAPDGGLMVSGSDFWWNTVRARATNTCEVYPTGGVKCEERPYAISPMQLTIFPLLGRDYFKGLSASGTSSWERSFKVYAAVVPGATGFAGNAYTWDCKYKLQGKGPDPDSAQFMVIQSHGTLDQEGGRYKAATSKAGILYDPAGKVPVFVRETRTHLPQLSVYNNDLIEVKLTKVTRSGQ